MQTNANKTTNILNQEMNSKQSIRLVWRFGKALSLLTCYVFCFFKNIFVFFVCVTVLDNTNTVTVILFCKKFKSGFNLWWISKKSTSVEKTCEALNEKLNLVFNNSQQLVSFFFYWIRYKCEWGSLCFSHLTSNIPFTVLERLH